MRVPVVIYGFAGKAALSTRTPRPSSSIQRRPRHPENQTPSGRHRFSHSQKQRPGARSPRRLSRRLLRPRNSRRFGLQEAHLRLLEKSRKKARVPKTFRVIVKGTDPNGHPFAQSAYTVDLSQDGARLDGVGFLTSPGQTIEVRRRWRKARSVSSGSARLAPPKPIMSAYCALNPIKTSGASNSPKPLRRRLRKSPSLRKNNFYSLIRIFSGKLCVPPCPDYRAAMCSRVFSQEPR